MNIFININRISKKISAKISSFSSYYTFHHFYFTPHHNYLSITECLESSIASLDAAVEHLSRRPAELAVLVECKSEHQLAAIWTINFELFMHHFHVVGEIVGLHDPEAVSIGAEHRLAVYALEVTLEVVQGLEGLCTFVFAAFEGTLLHLRR